MKPVIIAPLVALALAGGGAGTYFWVTSGGGVEETAVAQPTPTPAVETTEPPEPTPGVPVDWLTYTDPDFAFNIGYPPQFVWDDTVFDSLPPGVLKFLRFVDSHFASGYPPGQVTLSVFARDADTPAEWVFKHSAEGAPPADVESKQLYFFNVTNVRSVTVAGRSALAFDWAVESEGTQALHHVAFFSGPRVMVFGWEASDPSYAATAESTFNGIIETYKE
ncbi:MAG: hypothetical protein Q7R32_06965 [Dehalococcoidia bacterium]|nr:hypothetical protein [Dehalococcoidia bacterium]